MKSIFKYLFVVCVAASLLSCGRDIKDPGTEFAPQMYHSIAYEPLNQIVDKDFEYYNSNPNNPYGMTMRHPAPNTVKRTYFNPADTVADNLIKLTVAKDSVDLAKTIKSPYLASTDIAAQGKVLYGMYCIHCHGENGLGDGTVGKVYKGVPKYNAGRYAELTEGEIFHTITYGKGRMGSHASQVSAEERWKIVQYVQELQKLEE